MDAQAKFVGDIVRRQSLHRISFHLPFVVITLLGIAFVTIYFRVTYKSCKLLPIVDVGGTAIQAITYGTITIR